MSSAMMAPALAPIGHDLHMTEAETLLALSIFVLSFALGPLILSPLAEVYGRRPIWLLCSLCYVVWNTTCGFARNKPTLIVARLFAGIGASGEFAVCYSIKIY